MRSQLARMPIAVRMPRPTGLQKALAYKLQALLYDHSSVGTRRSHCPKQSGSRSTDDVPHIASSSPWYSNCPAQGSAFSRPGSDSMVSRQKIWEQFRYAGKLLMRALA